MIPIRDENPTARSAVVTFLLIAGSIGVFVWMASLDREMNRWVTYTLGMVPAVVSGDVGFEPYFPWFPAVASPVTALFLHADYVHLGFNMLFLWVFGNNVEDKLGHGRFLVFYLLAGLAAAAAHMATSPTSLVPMIGASGAISGVLGAYLLMFPFARVRTLIPPLIFRTFPIPAWVFLGLWFALQSVNASIQAITPAGMTEGGVAWTAHAAGFVAGMVLLLVLRPRGVGLFMRVVPAQGKRTGARKPARKPAPSAPASTAPAPASIPAPTTIGRAARTGSTISSIIRPSRRIVSR
ncbi:MAG: rhomboid family intramembrane serine protease [Alphaproteobacteria bacterium]